jgi:two-component system sensor histidine kinase/response regulator
MATVLIIDDDPMITQNIQFLLSRRGYEVKEALNGEEGIKAALACQPDLILCDVMMPGMTGFDVLETMRVNPKLQQIPFVFLTALSGRSNIRKGMTMGADDYLTKPFTKKDLLDTIETRLQKRDEVATQATGQAESIRERIVSLISQQLPARLASLEMVSEIINMQLKSLSQEELQEYADIIANSARRMSHLVQQLTYFAEIDAGRMSMEDNIGIWDLLIASLNMAREYATEFPDVTVQLNLVHQDIEITGNLPLLKHGLSELIINAIVFSQGTEVRIDQWAKEDGTCWITINDTGPGILPHIAQHEIHDGHGMGIPLARKIIELHDGSLEIKSVAGKGTQVTIGLRTAS